MNDKVLKKASWFWNLTGGRPMFCLDKCRFVDSVSGESVGLYVDKFGRMWLACGAWDSFRVEANPPTFMDTVTKL